MSANARHHLSLRRKITLIIVITAVILGSLAISISLSIYIDSTNDRYIDLCNGIADMMVDAIPAESIDSFLQDSVETDEYKAIEKELVSLQKSFPDVEYLYVYKILEDHCVAIFDLDTPDLPGFALGEIVEKDPSFDKYYDQLLLGEEIEPVISNDYFGWLLTVYKPIFGSDGVCRAYAGVDVSMQRVRADRFVFAIRMVSLLVGATIIIVAFVLWFVQRRISSPIDRLAYATQQFAFDDNQARDTAAKMLSVLRIKTGDEIENLYESITKMVTDVLRYISLINQQSMEVQEKASTIQRMQNNVIISFATMIEQRDACTGQHVLHTEKYVDAIGHEMFKEHLYPDVLTADYLANLPRSAPLHDVGKIVISDAILNKPGKLTPEEFDTIKTHTSAGGRILSGTMSEIEGNDYLQQAIDMATCHHERWDGAGYPKHLKGSEIPVCARIMAVADVFDALISKRSYKDPFPFGFAVETIRQESGTHFDPVVVDAFLSILDEIKSISEES